MTNEGELESIRAMQAVSCGSLYRMRYMQDLDISVLLQRMTMVTNILIDPNKVTGVGFAECSMFVHDTLKGHLDIIVSADQMQTVFLALSAVLEGDRLGVYTPEFVTDIIRWSFD